MLRDADIRDPLCDFLAEKHGEVRFFDEIEMGESRADIVMVSRAALYGIEIKSDADSYARLPRQIVDYDRYFDYTIIVAGSTHALHVQEHVPEHWGIIITNEERGKVDFYELRQPEKSPKAKLSAQLELLWRRELSSIQQRYKLHKYAGRARKSVERYVLESLEPSILKRELIEELFERDYTIF